MTLKKKPVFTPELLVEAPRRSEGVPNDSGTHVLFTVSTYAIDADLETQEVKILNVKTGQTTRFSDDRAVQEPQWLTGSLVLWKRFVDGGNTELWVGNALGDEKNAYLAGKIKSTISEIKTKALSGGTIAIAFSAPVSEKGELLNPESLPKSTSTAREFETTRIRFWNNYHKPYASTLWYTTLAKDRPRGKYALSDAVPVDALANTAYIYPWCTGFDAGGFYDISASGLLITTIDDITFDLPKRAQTETVYVSLKTFTEPQPPAPVTVTSKTRDLSSTNAAAFSPDGSMGVLLKQEIGKLSEAGHNHIFLFNLDDPQSLTEILVHNGAGQPWDLSPGQVLWSRDGKALFVVAETRGRALLYSIPLDSPSDSDESEASSRKPATATALTKSSSVSSIYTLNEPHSGIFVNSTSFIDSSTYSIVYPENGQSVLVSSATDHGALLGLDPSQISEFTFKGAEGYEVHSFILRPSGFQENKKYPLAFWVHGGPESAWNDSWSTRWNPAMFAEQGYILILPNPTGSTGFGEEFTRAILGDWGGRPYVDLEKCWEYVDKNLDYVDTRRGVILGASYGGYMMNWVAGKPLAKKFNAMVNHEGIFNISTMFACDIPTGLAISMGGELWEKQELWDQQDPSRYTEHWTQPMLIIHNDLDYRCPIEGGLAAFNVLQQKGIESRFLNYPDEGHFVLKRANSLHWNRTVLGWCNKFVGINDGIKLAPPVSEKYLRGRGSRKLAFRNRCETE